MNWIKNKRVVVLLSIVIVSIALDQLSKEIARDTMEYGQNTQVIGKLFSLQKVENKGAFLGMGDSLSPFFRTTLLLILPIIALGVMLIVILRKQDISLSSGIGLACVIGGGIGNLIDRALYGSVTDFMHMDFGIFQTGIFNVADVFVMIGIGALLVSSLKKPKPKVVEEEAD